MKDLSQIVLEMLASLNSVEKEKHRLIGISVDGRIDDDEYKDFARIKKQLTQITAAASTLEMWVDKMTMDGKLDKDKLDSFMEEI